MTKSDKEVIKNILQDKGITQTELANLLNTSKQYIGQMLNGNRGIGYKTKSKIASLYPEYFQYDDIDIPDIIDNPFVHLVRVHYNLSQEEFAKELGISKSLLVKLENSEYLLSNKHQQMFRSFCEKRRNKSSKNNTVDIKYLPEVKLSAGYGITVYDEHVETVSIDSKLLISEKGLRINPKYCKIVTVSGNSMLPEYRDGDKVIIDESIKEFIDGHIFAFGLNGQCYIKVVNVLPDRIKCIPLNDKYDTFYISENDNYNIFGMILPRIRL